MHTFKWLAIALAATPAVLLADSTTDRQIEKSAAASYNFHAVLQDRVTAKSDDGVVTLTGTVQDRDQKTLAENTVSDLPGVRSVNDRIEVASNAPAEHSDGWISFKIHMMLLGRANVSATDTDVSVQDGVVTLGGKADTQAQKELTEAYVKDIEGVRSVNNNITVIAPPGSPDQPRTMGEKIDDASITAEVKYELLTHRGTSAAKTSVKTKNGVVMVRGQADTAAERDLVTRLAKDVRGVNSVDNRMTVVGE